MASVVVEFPRSRPRFRVTKTALGRLRPSREGHQQAVYALAQAARVCAGSAASLYAMLVSRASQDDVVVLARDTQALVEAAQGASCHARSHAMLCALMCCAGRAGDVASHAFAKPPEAHCGACVRMAAARRCDCEDDGEAEGKGEEEGERTLFGEGCQALTMVEVSLETRGSVRVDNIDLEEARERVEVEGEELAPCPACGGVTEQIMKQVRSADEGETAFLRCLNRACERYIKNVIWKQ